ncbi:MAG: hypothetical protein WC675_04770 [Patescibacteria group bacterium]|jgi:hypothetical protein
MVLSFTKTALILAAGFFILAGCQRVINAVDYTTGKVQVEQKKQADKTLAQVKCQELCQTRLSSGDQDFEAGPCLSNAIVPDWVCDVAHNPRQSVDDEVANQCPAFREGTAHHFVEVDGNCNLIKVY